MRDYMLPDYGLAWRCVSRDANKAVVEKAAKILLAALPREKRVSHLRAAAARHYRKRIREFARTDWPETDATAFASIEATWLQHLADATGREDLIASSPNFVRQRANDEIVVTIHVFATADEAIKFKNSIGGAVGSPFKGADISLFPRRRD